MTERQNPVYELAVWVLTAWVMWTAPRRSNRRPV